MEAATFVSNVVIRRFLIAIGKTSEVVDRYFQEWSADQVHAKYRELLGLLRGLSYAKIPFVDHILLSKMLKLPVAKSRLPGTDHYYLLFDSHCSYCHCDNSLIHSKCVAS